MKILLVTTKFPPSIGGIETVMRLLAEEFANAGHEVRVITEMSEPPPPVEGYEVYTSPPWNLRLKLFRWSDVVCQCCISLKQLWPNLAVRRPVIVSHQTWYQSAGGEKRLRDRVKLFLCRFVHNVAISRPVAEHVGNDATVIPNPYDDEIYRLVPGAERNRQLVFVGRLVLDKGGETLLRALAVAGRNTGGPSLTVVGDGPELEKLKAVAVELGIADRLRFTGARNPVEISEILNRHQVLVVPSKWNEPFGIVALEGIACGCAVIGSSGGGLPEAIGPCGRTFPNGDEAALASAIRDLLDNPGKIERCRENAESHLNRHRKAAIAAEYISLFEKARA